MAIHFAFPTAVTRVVMQSRAAARKAFCAIMAQEVAIDLGTVAEIGTPEKLMAALDRAVEESAEVAAWISLLPDIQQDANGDLEWHPLSGSGRGDWVKTDEGLDFVPSPPRTGRGIWAEGRTLVFCSGRSDRRGSSVQWQWALATGVVGDGSITPEMRGAPVVRKPFNSPGRAKDAGRGKL